MQIYRKSPPLRRAPSFRSSRPIKSISEAAIPLADEVAAFVSAVRDRTTPAVTAEDGLRVMELSERIKREMTIEENSHHEDGG